MERVIFHGIRISEVSPKFGRADAELWGMTRANERYWAGQLTDWDRWFDLHSFEPSGLWPGLNASRAQTLDWYRQEPANARPIYMLTQHPDVPASRAYPLGEAMLAHAIAEDGTDVLSGCKMFGCTVDYLFGLALMQEGLREIILNGIGMSDDVGHQYVHRSILYWIGIARGMGITVTIDRPDAEFAKLRPISCYTNAGRKLYGYETYTYEDLDAILRFFSQHVPDDDPDLAALRALSASWRVTARSGPLAYADELDHLLAALQRRARLMRDLE